MSERDDEFYTGYLPEAPAGIADWTRKMVALLFLVAVVVALALVTGQKPFSKAVYEFGARDFEGVVRLSPYPTLELTRPGDHGEATAVSRYYLVNPFKHGAEVAQYDGQRVKLRGSLIYRGDQTMIEILPETVETLSAGDAAAARRYYGTHSLVGRIVDSKCWLGTMKPGGTKPHRACAVRCISGGSPPLFVVNDQEGPFKQLLLVGADGRAVNKEVLDFVAEPLEIRGEVERLDDLWILKADPETYRRR